MPPKRRAIGRSTPQARKRRALRASELDEQRALRLENLRVHATETRSSESSDQREVRLETDRIRTNQIRSSERTELRERRLQNVRISTARSRRTLQADLNLSAFHYDSNNDYSLHPNVVIGKMDKICMYCSALKFKNETRGMCCASGKVKLPELHSPPEPLSTFLSGVTRVEAFLGKYPQVQFMLPNDIVRCNEHSARKLHADIQSPRANLSSCRIASTIAGRRSQVPSNLFYGKQ
ncbi:uncharacterized protein TNCV_804371 [Trichonephila clavipes]|nr:uncharacterized protein TNCV_804371 [Trichonephila clavipes]